MGIARPGLFAECLLAKKCRLAASIRNARHSAAGANPAREMNAGEKRYTRKKRRRNCSGPALGRLLLFPGSLLY